MAADSFFVFFDVQDAGAIEPILPSEGPNGAVLGSERESVKNRGTANGIIVLSKEESEHFSKEWGFTAEIKEPTIIQGRVKTCKVIEVKQELSKPENVAKTVHRMFWHNLNSTGLKLGGTAAIPNGAAGSGNANEIWVAKASNVEEKSAL